MDVKIDGEGKLNIMRAGTWKPAECPHFNDGRLCGDHCALFNELGIVETSLMVSNCMGHNHNIVRDFRMGLKK